MAVGNFNQLVKLPLVSRTIFFFFEMSMHHLHVAAAKQNNNNKKDVCIPLQRGFQLQSLSVALAGLPVTRPEVQETGEVIAICLKRNEGRGGRR